ncbi:MAG: DcaP family trimeric outer membrane transporter [Pseudomonadota bacterium]
MKRTTKNEIRIRSAIRVAFVRQSAIAFASVIGVALTTPGVALAEDLSTLSERLEAFETELEAQAAEIKRLRKALEQAQQTQTMASDTQTADTEVSVSIERDEVSAALGRFPDAAIITAGDFDGAIKLPGSEASVKIGGFVRLEGNYDFDSLGFQDAVNHRRIPLDGSPEDGANQSRFHVRNSRFNIDYRRPIEGAQIRAFMEFDFFGSGDEFINNYEVRIRHVAANVGNFYAGQWWSQFTDIAASPETVDFGPPLGQPVLRNPGVRWAKDIHPEGVWRIGFGVENPAGDLTDPQDLFASDSVPNFTSFVEMKRDWGRVRLAGLALQLDSDSDTEFTGGFNLTGRIDTPWLSARDNLVFGVSGGEGFTHYYSVFAGAGLEGVIDSNGKVDATGIFGGYVGFQHWWSESVRSTLVASAVELDAPEGSTADAFDSGERYRVNLIWTPKTDVTMGVEYSHAAQETFDGREGDGSRLNAVVRVDF